MHTIDAHCLKPTIPMFSDIDIVNLKNIQYIYICVTRPGSINTVGPSDIGADNTSSSIRRQAITQTNTDLSSTAF